MPAPRRCELCDTTYERKYPASLCPICWPPRPCAICDKDFQSRDDKRKKCRECELAGRGIRNVGRLHNPMLTSREEEKRKEARRKRLQPYWDEWNERLREVNGDK